MIGIKSGCQNIAKLIIVSSDESVKYSGACDVYCRGSLEEGLEVLMMAAADSLISLRIVDCGHITSDRSVSPINTSSPF